MNPPLPETPNVKNSEFTAYVGWDNGVTGALAVLYPEGRVLYFKTPVLKAPHGHIIDDIRARTILAEVQQVSRRVVVVFEMGQKNPIKGTKWNYAQGESFGVVRTILRQNGYSAVGLNPKDWQKEMHQKYRKGAMDTKQASLAACAALFPNFPVPVSPIAKKPNDNMADALLMAAWGRKHEL